MEIGVHKIFMWNGKDLFLSAPSGVFTVMSFWEIPHEIREWLNTENVICKGRELDVKQDGTTITLTKTRQEIQADADRQHRHLEIRRDIAGLEASEESTRPQYVLDRLVTLRNELTKYEAVDPTATTLEQQRANDSITHKAYIPHKGQK